MLWLSALNQMDRTTFTAQLGTIYEDSPWVASEAWAARPFRSREELYMAMAQAVERAPRSRQLSLLQSHPDLGTRLPIGPLSLAEQRGVRHATCAPSLGAR
jgi:2-oxo-4-hydroxy-4-carboxy--5-ureidoimidazoline (OHCU) decarboxylase